MINNKKSLIKMWATLSFALTSITEARANTEARPDGLVFLAASTDIKGLKEAVGIIITIIIVIGFIKGTIAVMNGWGAVNRGEEGKLQIAGGIGTALAVPIMAYVYNKIVSKDAMDIIGF